MTKQEQGSTHAIVIGALTTALVCAIALLFWQNIILKKSSEGADTSANSEALKKSAIKNVHYCTKWEKICFDYPSSWSLDENASTKSSVVGADNIKLTSPDGGVILRFASGIAPNDGMGPGPIADGSIEVVSVTKLLSFREFIASKYSTQYAHVSEAVESVVETDFTDSSDPTTMFAKEKGYVPEVLLSNSINLSTPRTYRTTLGLINLDAIMQGKNALWDKNVPGEVGSFLFGTVMPYDGTPKMYKTSNEAKDMLKTDGFKQAKSILLSAKYE